MADLKQEMLDNLNDMRKLKLETRKQTEQRIEELQEGLAMNIEAVQKIDAQIAELSANTGE